MSALCACIQEAKHAVKGVAGEEGKEAPDQQLPCEQKRLTSPPGCPVNTMQNVWSLRVVLHRVQKPESQYRKEGVASSGCY